MSILLEVMDKEVGIPAFWISAVVTGTLGYLGARRWSWVLPVVVLLLGLSAWGVMAEWTDPYVGPAIRAEAGRYYPYHLWASTVLAVLMTIVGRLLAKRQQSPS